MLREARGFFSCCRFEGPGGPTAARIDAGTAVGALRQLHATARFISTVDHSAGRASAQVTSCTPAIMGTM